MMSIEKAGKIANAINAGDGTHYGSFVTMQEVLMTHRTHVVGGAGLETYAFQFGDLTCVARVNEGGDVTAKFISW